jgi:endonuclease IV
VYPVSEEPHSLISDHSLGEAPDSCLEDNISRASARLSRLLTAVPRVNLALENMVRKSSRCDGAWGLAAIGEIMTRIGSPRVQACVDICHAYIAHYDFYEPKALEAFVADLKALGPGGVAGFHVSDSFTPHGTQCDGHDK